MNDVPSWSPPAPVGEQEGGGEHPAPPAPGVPPVSPPAQVAPPEGGSTWARADLGFAAGPGAELGLPAGSAARGDKRMFGIVLVAVAVIGALVGAYLLLSGGEPAPVVLDRGIEPGGTYAFSVTVREDIKDETGGPISQYNSSFQGLMTFKVGRAKGSVTPINAQLNPHVVVVNGTPLSDQIPLRTTMRMGADGNTLCGGLFAIPWRGTRAVLPTPQLGPALPQTPTEVGGSWTLADEARCGKGLIIRYSSTGSLALEEREDDRRIAVISARTVVERARPNGTVVGEASIEESMRLDLDTGAILSAEGVSSGTAGPDLRGATSYLIEPVA